MRYMNNDFNIDLDKVRDFLDAKNVRRHIALDKSFDQATTDFDRIVKYIIQEYDPARVWQWGSLLDRTRFTEISDIDIALEGINDPRVFFSILGAASKMTKFPVDIVEIEKVGQMNADYIRNNGRKVYERKG